MSWGGGNIHLSAVLSPPAASAASSSAHLVFRHFASVGFSYPGLRLYPLSMDLPGAKNLVKTYEHFWSSLSACLLPFHCSHKWHPPVLPGLPFCLLSIVKHFVFRRSPSPRCRGLESCSHSTPGWSASSPHLLPSSPVLCCLLPLFENGCLYVFILLFLYLWRRG